MPGTTTERESWLTRCGDVTPTDLVNLRRYLWALAVWAIVLTGVSQLLKRDIVSGGLGWALAVLPLIAGVIAVFAYARYLREADDLQRLNHLKALGLGFAGGWLASFSSQLLEKLGRPGLDAESLLWVMILFYTFGIFRGAWKYR